MIIHKGNQSAPMGYHNGIPIWDGVKPEQAVYYMLSDGSSTYNVHVYSFIIPSILNTSDIYAEADIVISDGGDTFGVLDNTPSFSDSRDFRAFPGGGRLYFDAGGGRSNISMGDVGYDPTKRYIIRIEKNNTSCSCIWKEENTGTIIWNPTYTNGNNVNGYFSLKSRPNVKLYSLKIGNSNGLIVDSVATANGLYDKVAGDIISLPHFTPVKE